MQNTTIQIGDIQLTLEEAADTLGAIRGGKIDAVVVEGAAGHEVFTFRDASHPFRLLIEAMGEGALLTTVEGAICYQNPCFSDLVGIETSVAHTRTLADFVMPNRRAELAALLERARTASSARGTVELIGPGGRPVPVQVSVSRALLVDVDVFCVVVIDLTEPMRQEALYLAARHEIEARDRLFSVAAHELRNPLHALALQAELLQQLIDTSPLEQPLRERATRSVAMLHQQGKHLDALVGKLLDVGTIGAGRLRLIREDLDLADVVRSVLERAEDAIERSGSLVTLDLHPVRGRWDRIRIEQVVDNLVSNALKYGRGAPVHVAVAGRAATARVVVEDRGAGIPEEARERIFRPYERVSGTQHLPGLGIGLFVTAEIVKAHCGQVRVQSVPGGGSRFVVELPLDEVS